MKFYKYKLCIGTLKYVCLDAFSICFTVCNPLFKYFSFAVTELVAQKKLIQ